MIKVTSIVLVMVCAAGLQARDEKVRDFQKTSPLIANGTVHVEHSMGAVRVRTQAKQEVNVRATIRCSAGSTQDAAKCADHIDILVTETTGDVSVRTRYPENEGRNWFGGGISFSVDYDIVIPANAKLDLRNRFGVVEVSGLRAPGNIRNSNGRVTFSDGSGAQRLQNSFGPVEVTSNSGDVIIENTNGEVTVSAVTGAVDLRNRFGKITVTKVGSAVVHSNNGAVDASGVGGTATITNSFGGVTVTDAKGDVIVDNSNGSIDVRSVEGGADLKTSFASVKFSRVSKKVAVRSTNASVTGDSVGGSAQVATSFGKVDLRAIKGGARVQASNSSINLDEISGEVFASTSFGGVTVDDAGGPVTVENQNGSVTVTSAAKGACQPILLRTTFAPIKVALPSGKGYNLAAKTSFGKISSEHEVAASGTMGEGTLNGRIGPGGCELRLIDSNGSIDITRSVAK
jgi:hypothetical protein